MQDLTRIETKPGPWDITDPEWPTYSPYIPNPVITSDTFTGGDSIISGRMSDAMLGGEPMEWGADVEDRYKVVNGALTSGEARAVSSVGISHPYSDVLMSFTFSKLPTALGASTDSLFIDVWRSGTPDNSFTAAIRLQVNPNTQEGRLMQRIPGGVTSLGDNVPIFGGEKIEIGLVGQQMMLFIDGEHNQTVDLPEGIDRVSTTGFTGFATATSGEDFEIRDFTLRVLDHPELLA